MMHSLHISKADNGYVVSHYAEDGEKSMVAKDMDEAMMAAKSMMEKMHKEGKKENYKNVKEKANKMAMKK